MKFLVFLVASVMLCSATPHSAKFRPQALQTNLKIKPSDKELPLAYEIYLAQFFPISEIENSSDNWMTLLDKANKFQEFTEKYNKSYSSSTECKYRFNIFQQRLKEIEEKNSKLKHPVHGINQFADLTLEEFKKHWLGFKIFKSSYNNDLKDKDLCTPLSDVPNVEIPDSLDYNKDGLVTSVKDQGHCGSCWAFSATGNIESQYAKKYKDLVDFSEQQLVDCSHSGCFGWSMINALLLIISQGGIETLADYPYTSGNGSFGKCQFDKNKIKASLSGCERWDVKGSEDNLKKVLVSRGPLSVSIAADSLQTYTGGVLHSNDCSAFKMLDHGVLLTGYGKDPSEGPYWILKNSWTETFGEQGYFRIQYGVNCLQMVSDQAEIVNAIIA